MIRFGGRLGVIRIMRRVLMIGWKRGLLFLRMMIRMLNCLAHNKAIAVGETGLYFYKNNSPREDQIRVFKRHVSFIFC